MLFIRIFVLNILKVKQMVTIAKEAFLIKLKYSILEDYNTYYPIS